MLKAEFQTAQAVIAGQGQTVRVSGVRIGDIGAVELKDGRAIVRMDIDRKYKDMVHTDATALLRPKTGLKDMFIQLEPGTDDAPVAKENWTIPVDATTPDVNPDEILSLAGRRHARLPAAADLRRRPRPEGPRRRPARPVPPLRADAPRPRRASTARSPTRRTNLRRLITSLNQLNGELASHDDDLAGLVDSSAARAALVRLRGAEHLRRRRRAAEHAAPDDRLARPGRSASPTCSARPTERLRPAARALDPANEAVEPFAKEVTPLLANDIRPFVREARPLVRDLRPAVDPARRRRARPDAHVHAAQQLLQPARLQPERPRGPGERRAPGGLPVLAGVGAAHGDPAVLDLRRQRRVPPGHARRAVRDDRADDQGPAGARVPRRCSRRCSPTPRPARPSR